MKRSSFISYGAPRVVVAVTAVCTLPLWAACSLNPVSEDPSVQFASDEDPRGEDLAPSPNSPTPITPPDMAGAPNGAASPSASQSPVPSSTAPAPTATLPGEMIPEPPENVPTDDAPSGEQLEAGSDAGVDAAVGVQDATTSTVQQQEDGGLSQDAAAP